MSAVRGQINNVDANRSNPQVRIDRTGKTASPPDNQEAKLLGDISIIPQNGTPGGHPQQQNHRNNTIFLTAVNSPASRRAK